MAHGEALPGSGFWTPVESTGLLTPELKPPICWAPLSEMKLWPPKEDARNFAYEKADHRD